MKRKYVRIQARYCGKTGKPVGIFGACWHLMKGPTYENTLNDKEKQLFFNIDNWFTKNLPEPPFYNDGNTVKAITWFKTDTSQDMIKRLRPLMKLLEKYNIPYDIVYADNVGRIIYEDDYQVGVI